MMSEKKFQSKRVEYIVYVPKGYCKIFRTRYMSYIRNSK